jgi:preprotein translocase subunit SecG
MTIFATIIHVIVCIALIMIVLLQTGKGSDMGAAFGGSSQTLFGSTGPVTFLNKLTTVAAILFMLTSLGLAYFSSGIGSSSIMRDLGDRPGVEEELPDVPDIPFGEE